MYLACSLLPQSSEKEGPGPPAFSGELEKPPGSVPATVGDGSAERQWLQDGDF